MSSQMNFSVAPEVIRNIRSVSGLPPAEALSNVQERLDRLENVTLDIAVTGETGAGKSTFVNALLGLRDGDPGSAETGVTETTLEPSRYPHPTMPNVNIWDLPGIGGIKFKAKDYLKQVQFDRYDFFIIVSSGRFREHDIMLAREIQKKKKLFYFVRSKIDGDIQAEQRKPNHDIQNTLSRIRENCVENLIEIGGPKVFLISSFNLEMYDFLELTNTLRADLPEHKSHALIQSLPVCSLQMIEEKKKTFEEVMWASSFASAAIAVIPIPGLSAACDTGILVAFLLKCYHSFGLDEKSLKRLSERMNKPVEDLKAVMTSPYAGGVNKKAVLRVLASATIGGAMALEYLLSNIPVVGSLAAGGISFATTYYLLNTGLDDMAKDAKAVLTAAGLE
ncbi:interferon-inducible GTPase 5-like [Megalops cyprinoides]|uniref:interferon-inducible GTPase 5-like n=1 Tax=Megalops cyprinoides TaxID=118141 RepID=UPI0018640B25|nr:interferon-inducible GTPase 5-like [Megalops cyprinoides]